MLWPGPSAFRPPVLQNPSLSLDGQPPRASWWTTAVAGPEGHLFTFPITFPNPANVLPHKGLRVKRSSDRPASENAPDGLIKGLA